MSILTIDLEKANDDELFVGIIQITDELLRRSEPQSSNEPQKEDPNDVIIEFLGNYATHPYDKLRTWLDKEKRFIGEFRCDPYTGYWAALYDAYDHHSGNHEVWAGNVMDWERNIPKQYHQKFLQMFADAIEERKTERGQ